MSQQKSDFTLASPPKAMIRALDAHRDKQRSELQAGLNKNSSLSETLQRMTYFPTSTADDDIGFEWDEVVTRPLSDLLEDAIMGLETALAIQADLATFGSRTGGSGRMPTLEERWGAVKAFLQAKSDQLDDIPDTPTQKEQETIDFAMDLVAKTTALLDELRKRGAEASGAS